MRAIASRRAQSGYVLVMVLASLAVITLLAARFAARVDALRDQASTLSAYAQGQIDASSAQQAALYWMTTHHPSLAGFGSFPAPELRADGRTYRLPSNALLQVQDQRGLYPLNAPTRASMALLLARLGAKPELIDTLIDVLLDYEDTDKLKRLNGAEDAEYQAMRLPPPRNDFLLSVGELQRLPFWRDQPELLQSMMAIGSTNRDDLFNPNTAPSSLLTALLPSARPEQLELMNTLRRNLPFASPDQMRAATGLSVDAVSVLLHVSLRHRITVWAPGLPQAIQYNVALDLAGATAPWKILDVQPVPREKYFNAEPTRVTPFPLAVQGP